MGFGKKVLEQASANNQAFSVVQPSVSTQPLAMSLMSASVPNNVQQTQVASLGTVHQTYNQPSYKPFSLSFQSNPSSVQQNQQPPLVFTQLNEPQQTQFQPPPVFTQPNQQQQYNGNKYYGVVLDYLTKCVNENRWNKIYPQHRIVEIAKNVSNINFDKVATDNNMKNIEFILELSKLALVDVVLLCDDSGSMIACDYGERWNSDLKMILKYISKIICLFDTDGITLRFFNTSERPEFDNINSPEKIDSIVAGVHPSGGTPIGESLRRKITSPFFNIIRGVNLETIKPLVVIIITDGEPTDNYSNSVETVITSTKNDLLSKGFSGTEVSYSFVQVGKDKNAQAFLDSIDNSSTIGDVVDATSYFEFEEEQCRSKGFSLSVELYIIKLLLASFNRSWDDMD